MAEFESPPLEEFGPLLIAGLGQRYNDGSSVGIPALWQRFVPHIGRIPGQIGGKTYGVICNMDAGSFDYVCGVEVSAFPGRPADFFRISLPKQKYAVFSHVGHISTIRDTWNMIWKEWLPKSAMRIANVPRLEIYSENFNPASTSGVEIWIPIEE